VLHGLRAAVLAERGQRDLARRTVQLRGADLDQLVGRQRALDFGHHRVGEALAAQVHERPQGVRARLQGLAFCRGQAIHG